MIVKNEERWLTRCLQSASGVVDEIVIVDTGSTDRTVEIASEFHAAILHHDWQDDFSLARNVSLERATGDWILVLDADEELEVDSQRRTREVICGTPADGLLLRNRSLMPAGELQRHEDLMLTRLFRNRRQYRYEQPIHEQIRPSIERCGGVVSATDLTILHHGYAQRKAQGTDLRAERNLRLLNKALSESPGDPYLHYQIGITLKALGDDKQAYESLCHVLKLDVESLGNETVDRLYMRLAQLALASDRFAEATRHASASLARNPNNVVSLHVLALAHMFQGNVRDAYPVFLRVRQSPNLSAESVGQLDAVISYCQDVVGDEA
jgi:hypothetical protein